MSDEVKSEIPLVGDTFQFSKRVASDALREVDLELTALDDRITKLVERVKFEKTEIGLNVPILAHILRLGATESELVLLGNALVRVAPLVKRSEELTQRKDIINFALQSPNIFAATFGDFSSSFNQAPPV